MALLQRRLSSDSGGLMGAPPPPPNPDPPASQPEHTRLRLPSPSVNLQSDVR